MTEAAGSAERGRRGIPLFRVAGMQVRLDYSWLLIFFLVLWSLSAGYFPRVHPDESSWAYWSAGLLSTLLFFGSVLAHEIAHSLVAIRSGIEVPSITLFLFGGASEMANEPEDPRTELSIAIVGPLTSFALAGAFWGVGALLPGTTPALFEGVVRYLAWINVALGVFNLLPGLPLDGGRVLRALVWWRTGSVDRASRIAADAGRGLAIGIMVLGGLQIFAGGLIGGLWLILIGLFVRGLAGAEHQSRTLRRALDGVTVREVMAPDPVTVSPDLTLQELVDDYVLRHGFRGFPVVEGGRAVGLISIGEVKEVPVEKRRAERVRDRLVPVSQVSIAPDRPLSEALVTMARTGHGRLLVLDAGGRLAGLLSRTGLSRFVEIRRVLDAGGEAGAA